MTPKKPNFIIIGSAKCGTTTLAAILDRHPDCCFSHPKEVCFFQDTIFPAQYDLPPEMCSSKDMLWHHLNLFLPNPNFVKGWDWYCKAWSHFNGEPLIGEASPAYSDRTNSPQTASRIHAFNREMKIIYMVREPMARMISYWQMRHRFTHAAQGLATFNEARWAKRGFEFYMASRMRREAFWDQTRYHYQMEPYLKLFPREQILVSFLEDWKTDQKREVSRILSFLTLDPSKLSDQDTRPLNVAPLRAKHSALQRMIIKSRMRSLLKSITGPKLWGRISVKYARTGGAPWPAITLQTMNNFMAYIREDNQAFLKEWNKPTDFWTPAEVALLES
jgi:hypothetical protein